MQHPTSFSEFLKSDPIIEKLVLDSIRCLSDASRLYEQLSTMNSDQFEPTTPGDKA